MSRNVVAFVYERVYGNFLCYICKNKSEMDFQNAAPPRRNSINEISSIPRNRLVLAWQFMIAVARKLNIFPII